MINIREYLEEVIVLSISVLYRDKTVVSYTGEISYFNLFNDGTFCIQFEDEFAFSFSSNNGNIDENNILHLYDSEMEVVAAIIEKA